MSPAMDVAFPLISKQLVQAHENTASFNGWKINIGSPITEPDDDVSVETHEYDAYDYSDDESIPPSPPTSEALY